MQERTNDPDNKVTLSFEGGGSDGSESTPSFAARDATPRAELWLYFWIAVAYIGTGFFVKQIFAWWWFGAAWFVGLVWLIPNIGRWWRNRRQSSLQVPGTFGDGEAS
jgi:hypothetical protein